MRDRDLSLEEEFFNRLLPCFARVCGRLCGRVYGRVCGSFARTLRSTSGLTVLHVCLYRETHMLVCQHTHTHTHTNTPCLSL